MADRRSVWLIYFLFFAVLAFFTYIIFIPSVYILTYFQNTAILTDSAVIRAIASSFGIGAAVTCINLLFGIPLAWVLTRVKNVFTRLIDNLIDLSLVIPTAALGFSVFLYWGSRSGPAGLLGMESGFFSKGPLMVILLHTIFTIPYMIRSVAAAIQQLENQNEEAAVTLGASPFTFFRTVAMPLFKNGVINGAILSFTRSLSETGATIMVAGTFATAPVLIISLKDAGNLPAAAGVSIFLIVSAVVILFTTKLFLGERKYILTRVYPEPEKILSRAAWLKNAVIFGFFFIFIFLPTIQIIFFGMGNFSLPESSSALLESLMVSLGLAFTATCINLVFSVPFSYLIARNILGIGTVIDSLGEVVLLVPTGALGLSLAIFWRQFFSSDLLILLFAHICFTFPLLIKPITAAIREVSPSQEEASFSLGAGIGKTFTKILVPQIKPAVAAGCIMAFMRSLSETGATLAVTSKIKTLTVLIVEQFNTGNLSEAAFACMILFGISFIFLVLLKRAGNQSISTG